MPKRSRKGIHIYDEYYSVAGAAETLGLSKQRIRCLIKRRYDARKRVLVGEKICRGDWMIAKTEVERFRKLPAKVGRPKGSKKRGPKLKYREEEQ